MEQNGQIAWLALVTLAGLGWSYRYGWIGVQSPWTFTLNDTYRDACTSAK
jgi:hypothetical protein